MYIYYCIYVKNIKNIKNKKYKNAGGIFYYMLIKKRFKFENGSKIILK